MVPKPALGQKTGVREGKNRQEKNPDAVDHHEASKSRCILAGKAAQSISDDHVGLGAALENMFHQMEKSSFP